jgi:hypothetical protein
MMPCTVSILDRYTILLSIVLSTVNLMLLLPVLEVQRGVMVAIISSNNKTLSLFVISANLFLGYNLSSLKV